jgi:hypothetical protein
MAQINNSVPKNLGNFSGGLTKKREKMKTTRKSNIKTFKRFVTESNDKWYSLDLTTDMTNEQVALSIAELTPYAIKILRENDAVIKLEPVFADDE